MQVPSVAEIHIAMTLFVMILNSGLTSSRQEYYIFSGPPCGIIFR